jgi:transmembrane sensor
MSSPPPSTLPYTDTQRREAADWFIVIHAESDPKAESIQAWLRWMDQHEGNRAAFDAVAQAWHATPGSSALAMPSAEELLLDDYDGDQPVEEWLRGKQSPVHDEPTRFTKPAANRARIPRRAWLAAASVAIALAIGLLTMHRYPDWRGPNSDEFTTKTGERIEITLADGSHVWLGPKSVLLVAFNKVRRDIRLTTGEAYFAVKKDHNRPFTVRSTGGDIVAVGTAFNVRAIDDHVTVAVSEGVVTVMPKAQLAVPDPASVRVASGQQLTFTAQQPIKALAIIQSPSGERARWRDGVLIYRDEPLQEVVSDVVRYSNLQIEIADTAVGNLHYSGVIYQDAVHEWVSALPESFPVTVVSDGTRQIIKAR